MVYLGFMPLNRCPHVDSSSHVVTALVTLAATSGHAL